MKPRLSRSPGGAASARRPRKDHGAMSLQLVCFFLFLRVAPNWVRSGNIAVIPCSECQCRGIIVQDRGGGEEMAPYIVVASTRRCMSSDIRIVIESDSEREAFISGQSVHLRSDGGFAIFSNVRSQPVTCQESGMIARKGHSLLDTSTPCSLSALVPWCLSAFVPGQQLTG
jgi:hypothetical protein